jgi:hypothetical protein
MNRNADKPMFFCPHFISRQHICIKNRHLIFQYPAYVLQFLQCVLGTSRLGPMHSVAS